MNNRVALAANVMVGVDALRIHPLRTALSVAGIIIGSASLVATMAVSDGMMGFARGQIEQETSVQVVTVGSRTMSYQNGRFVPITDYPVFTPADAERLERAIPSAAAVTMSLGGRAMARYRGVEYDVSVSLGTAQMPEFAKLDIGAGRFFSPIEAARNAPVVILNHALARELAAGRDPFSLVGEQIQVRQRVRRVIGVLVRDPFEELDDPSFLLIAPIRAAGALLDPPPGGRFTPTLQLKAPTVEAVLPLRDATIDWLASRYVRWRERVRVTVGLEMLAEMEQAILLTKLFIGSLVGISLLVGGIGIMNVLLASVTERTREIGIRKAVGARRGDIRTQFLAESVAIAVAGTGIGLVLGLILAALVTAVISRMAGVGVTPVLSLGTVLLAIVSSSVVGLVFGTYPARRAAELAPIEAIAHE